MRPLLLALLLLVAPCAQAGTLLYLHSGPGDFAGEGAVKALHPPDSTFTVSVVDPNAVRVTVEQQNHLSWTLTFYGAGSAPLAPGHYNSLGRPDDAYLNVSGEGRSCSIQFGAFDVRTVVVNQFGEVDAFAADFVQYCGYNVAPLVGSIRFQAGDAGCTADGAPCDDLDACTSDDHCQAGRCEGTAVPCSDGDACTGGDLCDPSDGVCRGGDRLDCNDGNPCNGAESCDAATGACVVGTPIDCNDGNACNGSETCNPSGGGCNGGTPLDCDDHDACTLDSCDAAAGCVHERSACWVLVGHQRGTACADGRCASQTSPFQRLLLLLGDDRYVVPGGNDSCQIGKPFPDEHGSVRAASGGRLRLVPDNLDELVDAQNACSSVRLKIRSLVRWLRPADDGATLTGSSRLNGSGRTRGRTVPLTITERYRGRRVE